MPGECCIASKRHRLAYFIKQPTTTRGSPGLALQPEIGLSFWSFLIYQSRSLTQDEDQWDQNLLLWGGLEIKDKLAIKWICFNVTFNIAALLLFCFDGSGRNFRPLALSEENNLKLIIFNHNMQKIQKIPSRTLFVAW